MNGGPDYEGLAWTPCKLPICARGSMDLSASSKLPGMQIDKCLRGQVSDADLY